MISVTRKTTDIPEGNARLAVQITKLVDSYMVWVGSSDRSGEDVDPYTNGLLCKDWAYAIPGSKVGTVGTSLFRTSTSDVALTMAQRIAKKIDKAVFLSVDVAPEHVLQAEKWVVTCLKSD